jgi:anti-anti-sigma regulatory factor
MTEIILSLEKELTAEGGTLGVVGSSRAVGMKSLLLQIKPRVKVSESVDGAVEEVRKSQGEKPVVAKPAGEKPRVEKPRETAAAERPAVEKPAPEKPAARLASSPAAKPELGLKRITDAKRGIVVDARENLTLVWVRRKDFGQEVLEFLSEVLAKSANDVYIDCREIREITKTDLDAIDDLMQRLKAQGRNLRLVNPDENVTAALETAKLDNAIARTAAAKDPSSTAAPS